MNILILFSQPWRVGGAETHTEALIKGLAGHNVSLIVNDGSDQAKLDQMRKRYAYITIDSIQTRGANLLRWQRDFQKLCRLIQERSIDVISAQQRTSGIWAYFLHRRLAIPYTVTMHDPWHRAMFKPLYAKLFHDVFAVSRNLADHLVTNFKIASEQVHVINNGIDFTAFHPLEKADCRTALGLGDEDKIILHVSRLSRVKGAVALQVIASMEMVLKENPQAKLIIIGEGPLRQEIDMKLSQCKARFGQRFEIRNFVDNLLLWYNAADVLVGEGRVAMETLACEKPIVAIRNGESFIGAIRAKNIAYACDVNFDGRDNVVNPSRLAAEILISFGVSPAECKEIASYIKTRLSIEAMVNQYLAVFEKLTAR